jgi:hypothetical protein
LSWAKVWLGKLPCKPQVHERSSPSLFNPANISPFFCTRYRMPILFPSHFFFKKGAEKKGKNRLLKVIHTTV